MRRSLRQTLDEFTSADDGGRVVVDGLCGRGLYITACNDLFKIRLKAPGVRPGRKG